MLEDKYLKLDDLAAPVWIYCSLHQRRFRAYPKIKASEV